MTHANPTCLRCFKQAEYAMEEPNGETFVILNYCAEHAPRSSLRFRHVTHGTCRYRTHDNPGQIPQGENCIETGNPASVSGRCLRCDRARIGIARRSA